MKGRILISIIVLFFAGPLFGQERALLKEKKDRMSYAIGVDVGNSLIKQHVDVNLDVLKEAIGDVLSNRKLLLTDKERAEIKADVERDMAEEKARRQKTAAEKNRKEEEKFLAENKLKNGVVTLPSGLQYTIVTDGAGKVPKEDDMVSAHYRVSLIDGTEVEDSQKKGEPGEFVLENVIPGWREGVGMMKTGSKWRLFIPSKLAYGEDGVGELVGPNTMLIFDIDLLKIIDRPDQKTTEETEAKTEDTPTKTLK
jgi:FKBP-type peptidyl-prolyl cis-trans isomerase